MLVSPTDRAALAGCRFLALALRYERELSAEQAGRALAWLTPHERQRYERCWRPARRLEYLLGRALMRYCLGQLLGLAPQEVSLAETAQGKPVLAAGHGQPPLCFNLAHTPSMLLLGVTVHGDIGVDVEFLRPYQEAIARQFFHPEEQRRLAATAPAARPAAFCRLWTIKEACLKARGSGIVLPLDTLLVRPGSRGRCGELRWQTLALGPQLRAAVALLPARRRLPAQVLLRRASLDELLAVLDLLERN